MAAAPAARRVFLESPYSGNIAENIKYAIECTRDSLHRGEAPFASHLLYTLHPVHLFVADGGRHTVAVGREGAIAASQSWRHVADVTVFYVDLGWSSGMSAALQYCKERGLPWEERSIRG